MPSETADSSLVDVLLRPAFVLGVLLVVGFAYSVFVFQRVLPGVMALGSLALTAFVVWLLYRLVVAVEDLASTARRVETSLDDE